ncbi:MAG: hypothetical protein MZW92_13230 [Comamonadaceae bacterium]|nr:hypothetical protein [Comamonadaceae bacterium]
MTYELRAGDTLIGIGDADAGTARGLDAAAPHQSHRRSVPHARPAPRCAFRSSCCGASPSRRPVSQVVGTASAGSRAGGGR